MRVLLAPSLPKSLNNCFSIVAILEIRNSISKCFTFALHCWLIILSIISCNSWLFVYLSLWHVCSVLLYIFIGGFFYFSCNNSLYILHTDSLTCFRYQSMPLHCYGCVLKNRSFNLMKSNLSIFISLETVLSL